MSDLSAGRALLRYHLRTGVRVGLRSLVPLAGGLVAAAVLEQLARQLSEPG